MKTTEIESFTLDNFEGPLDFLLYLIQKGEIDIHDVSVQRITQQFLSRLEEALNESSVDLGAEFIAMAGSLHLQKSKRLLPKTEQENDDDLIEFDPEFEVIHQLVEYCRFKGVTKDLMALEANQCSYFPRGATEAPEITKSLGVKELSLEDLASVFQEALSRSADRHGLVHEEKWRISDITRRIKKSLKLSDRIRFSQLFTSEKGRNELIVTFLSVLEMMKLGDIIVIRNEEGEIEVRRDDS
jgi:segregation and condensation protein A